MTKIFDLNEKLFVLEKSNITLKSKVSRLEENIFSNTFVTDKVIRYDRAFQHFLDKSIDRSKIASMIYGVSRNGSRGLGYSGPSKKIDETLNVKPKALSEHFVLTNTNFKCPEQEGSDTTIAQTQTQTQKETFKPKYHVQISHDYPVAQKSKGFRTFVTYNKRGPRKWLTKDQIIYVTNDFDGKT